MKTTASECAGSIRKVGMLGSVVLGDEICAHLDRLAAIDSAAPGEVGQIDRVHRAVESHRNVYGIQPRDAHDAHRDRGILLTIVQRQVGEIAALKHEHFAATIAIEQTLHETEQRSDAARAEVERLKADLQQTKDELSAAAHSARSYAEQMDMAIADKDATREASDRWQRKLHAEYGVTEKMRAQVSALAQENARLINEVGLLDATAREQRQRAEVLARGIAAYRSGSFTLAQVWENEEGKAVT